MKNSIIATLAAAGVSLAAANANAQELTGSANIGIESEYIFRGVDLAGESIQANLEGIYGATYFGVWTNEPLEDEFDNEIDFYAGYNYAINANLNADFGATLYYYPESDAVDGEVGDDETTEVYLGLNNDSVGAPALYAFYDFDLEALTLEASLSHAYDVHEKGAIEVGAAAGWVDETGGTEYFYYNVTADYVYTIGDAFFATFGVRVGGNDDKRGADNKDDHAWGGFTLNYAY